MLAFLIGASLCAQSSIALQPERRYATEFARGVAALAHGSDDRAAAAFRAAGIIAPRAPLWPLYLAAAEGREVSAPVLQADAGGPWRPLNDFQGDRPRFSADGRFVVVGWSGTIWDVTAGRRVSATQPPEDSSSRYEWDTDRSGRYLIGLCYATGSDHHLRHVEVRHLATGETACPPLPADVRAADGTHARWSDQRLDPLRSATDGPYFAVRRAPLDGGTLTVIIPRRGVAGGSGSRAVIRDDGQRALVGDVDRSTSSWPSVWVVGVDGIEAPVELGGASSGACFSRDGKLVLTGRGRGPFGLFDAETGAAVHLPDGFRLGAGAGDAHRIQSVDAAGQLYVATDGRVRVWDLKGGDAATIELVPRLREHDWLLDGAMRLTVLPRARALIFSTDSPSRGFAVYDADSGQQLWTRPQGGEWDWNETDQHGWIVVDGGAGTPKILDARTGETVRTISGGATAAAIVRPFAYAPRCVDATGEGLAREATPASREAALVAAADGTLRTFELATGETIGSAEGHRGSRILGLDLGVCAQAAPRPCAITWDESRRVALLDLPDLTVRAEWSPDSRSAGPANPVRGASATSGTVVFERLTDYGDVVTELIRIADGAVIASALIERLAAVAYSADGDRVALVGPCELVVFHTRSGEVLASHSFGEPSIGKIGSACAFHGPSQFVIGWGTHDLSTTMGVGVDVLDLATGARVARHRARSLGIDAFGGWVGDIESMPDLGSVAYSVSASGMVFLLGDQSWIQTHILDFSGGSQSTLELERREGSERLFTSGMSDKHSRVVSATTLMMQAGPEVVGLADLCESPRGRTIVGRGAGRVHVLDGATFETLYVREELAGPGTRLILNGTRLVDRDADPTVTRGSHLARQDTSHPLGCFDAWLDDPLGLATVTLDQLPQPPRVDAGPPRAIRADASTTSLRFHASDEVGLLGAWLVVEGRAPCFLPLSGRASTPRSSESLETAVQGPWPIDVELIAVGVTGLESKPWRVRIEGAERQSNSCSASQSRPWFGTAGQPSAPSSRQAVKSRPDVVPRAI